MKRSYLMRRPDSDDEEDYYSSSREVKSKPIDSRYASAFGGQKPSTFVRASEQSQQEFYGKQKLMARDDGGESSSFSRRPLTADEKNKLSAKILKAEMAGKKDKAKKLKKQLESGFAESDDDGADCNKTETKTDDSVLLMKIDKRTGIIQPATSDNKMSGERDQSLKGVVDSEFNRAASLDELVRDEKRISSADQLAMFNRAAKMTSGNKVDDDWVIDDNITSFKHKKRHEEKDVKKAHSKRVADHKRLEQTLNSCSLCLESRCFDKLTCVAVGFKTYLAVVPWKGLDRFHCRIIPSEHYSSQVTVDEDVFAELRLWRKGLVAMFRAQDDEDCVFIESAKNVQNTLHMAIECIPLPRESGDLAPIYFKQALEQAGERWGTHRKIINLADTKEKTVRRAIPPGFSYFAIDFGLQPGYAHVIENETSFPAHFAQEIISGMLDLDHKLWRRPEIESPESLKQKRDSFRERWAPFDWTETARQRVNETGSSKEEG